MKTDWEGKKSTWNLQKNKFFKQGPSGADIRLEIINLGRQNTVFHSDITKFRKQFSSALASYGFNPPTFGRIQNTYSEHLRSRSEVGDVLDAAFEEMKDPKPKLVLIILPSKDTKFYAAVNWWGDCSRGVATVCVTKAAMLKKETYKDADGDSLTTIFVDEETWEQVDKHDPVLLGNLR
jgi:hypothetical protein